MELPQQQSKEKRGGGGGGGGGGGEVDKVSPPPSSSPSSTSPSHDFSFTISLHPTPPSPTSFPPNTSTSSTNCTKPSLTLTTVDLSPADDIFLHGHLLPLQIISNTNTSPRNSDTSVENFTLPLDRVESDLCQRYSMNRRNTSNGSTSTIPKKNRSFSSVFKLGNWRTKAEESYQKEDHKTKKNRKRLMELGHVLKKYISMVEHMLFYNKGETERKDLRRRPHSFSVHSNPREREKWRKRKGQRSAPASMRTSPANSGHLSVASLNKLSSSSDESTMEELQNAIQAAIAHCKSSIAAKGSRESVSG